MEKHRKFQAFILGLSFLCIFQSAKAAHFQSYGHYVVKKAWEQLSWIYLNVEDCLEFGRCKASESERTLLKRFLSEGLFSHPLDPKKKVSIEFRPGSDPIFKLDDDQPVRTAVTASEINDPIFFNTDRINGPDFTYAKCVALWIHELGHKLKGAQQNEVDHLANLFESAADLKEERIHVKDSDDEVVVIQHYNGIQTMGDALESPPTLGLIRKEGLFTFENTIFGPRDNYHIGSGLVNGELQRTQLKVTYINAWIHNLTAQKVNDEEYQFTMDFTAGQKEVYSDRTMFLGPAKRILSFSIADRDRNDKFELVGFRIASSFRPVAAPGIQTRLEIDKGSLTHNKFKISAEITGVPDYAYILTVDRLFVNIDGLLETLHFSYYPFSEDRMYRRFEAKIEIPNHFESWNEIEIVGLGGQAYYPTPPPDQTPYNLFYLFPLDAPIVLEKDLIARSECEDNLKRKSL